jgi:hypothetical protein
MHSTKYIGLDVHQATISVTSPSPGSMATCAKDRWKDYPPTVSANTGAFAKKSTRGSQAGVEALMLLDRADTLGGDARKCGRANGKGRMARPRKDSPHLPNALIQSTVCRISCHVSTFTRLKRNSIREFYRNIHLRPTSILSSKSLSSGHL